MQRIIDRIADVLVTRKWQVLAVLVIVTLGLGVFMKNLKIDNALDVWFLDDDPTLVRYNEFKKIYGNDEIIAVWVPAPAGPYDRAFVAKIHDVSKRLKTNPLVRRVVSITAAPFIEGRAGRLIVEDMVPARPGDGFDAAALQRRFAANPLWPKLLLNRDSTAMMVIVEPVATPRMEEERPRIIAFVQGSFAGLPVKLAGNGVVYQELNRLSMADSSLFTTLSFIILLITIVALFRKLPVLIASVATMSLASLLFLGIFGLFSQRFNMVSAILPSLIVILCLEDVIFIFSNYYSMPQGARDIKKSIAYSMVPCFMTSFTTAIGFFSFSVSPMAILRSFGIFAAVGVMVEFAVAVIICTIIIARLEERGGKDEAVPALAPGGTMLRIMGGVADLVAARPRIILGASLVLLVLAAVGASRIVVDTYSIDFLRDSNPVKIDSKFIEGNYGNYLPLEVRLRPKGEAGVKDPAFLEKLAGLQTRLEQEPDLQRATSIVDVVKALHRALTGDPGAYRVPPTRDAVAQELLLYELDAENDLSYFVDEDYRECRLTVRVPMVSSQGMKAFMDRAESIVKQELGEGVTVTFGGYLPLYVKLVDYTAQSQITSFIMAFFLIFLVTGLYFRSMYYFSIIVLPNVLPVMVSLAIMGVAGIRLDIATVTIAAITIGLSVDNSIHYLVKFRQLRAGGMASGTAVRESLMVMGAPMFISNAILVLGYWVMLFAGVKSVIYFGLIIGLTMMVALLCDLILLPALLVLFPKRAGD